MIGMIEGTVESVDSATALINVNGIGFEVRMPVSDLSSMHSGQDLKIYTSLNVSQDAVTLYGFLATASKKMFLQLQKVSGIGPRVALSLLSTLPPERLARTVMDGDATALAKAPGLGKKGAQKIILELRGSINLDELAGTSNGSSSYDAGTAQVIDGLVSLGWRERDAEHAVAKVCQEHHFSTPLGNVDVPQVLKFALTSLDRGR
ncbi:Holliday junction DNA helicase subunit RuvA [Bifidobacterium bohemicum]|uniref:Holliday junction branch migration complex subunit RuvA n=1 Tax=Bifidobacterium bohemicum DSM 22767 TaxID=1437606 RepID=A0A086ZJ58_9BIFI|nr:Holliday junction branch migration protein RuvA [Bifidobacterium bohemicum]KFI46558.1 holliday junction DNA helicase RuvA [Bifidobacterium bohemicum DSM 22767]SCB75079.1 Holliday junction DNA helicase subunit RuvA [Bifidobacterium bohemicum]